METLQFSKHIDAAPEKVWEQLWNKDSYTVWTTPFMEGSYLEGDLEQGGKVRFLAPGGSGMYSIVQKMVPGQTMVFCHQGNIKDNMEQPQDETTKKWAGAIESYELQPNGSGTTVNVKVDVTGDFKDYLNSKFPEALNELKRISEQ